MGTSTEMPKYKCHKEIWALKIKRVEISSASAEIYELIFESEDVQYAPREVPAKYIEEYNPQPGGYFIIERGCASYSSGDVFEEDYTHQELVTNTMSPQNARMLFEARIGRKIPYYIVTTDEMMLDAISKGMDIALGLADAIASEIKHREELSCKDNYHVHVYRIPEKAEIELEGSEQQVMEQALALAKAGELEFKESDNQFMALPFLKEHSD